MTADDDQPEDVAGLFKKFGGDPHAYKEFEPRDELERGTAGWPLVRPTPAPGTPTPSPAPVAAGAARPATDVSALFAAPAPTAPPAMQANAAATPDTRLEGGRELDALFARLLGAPASHAAAGRGLLSQWRSQP